METNNKGRLIIRSIEELRPSQRRQLKKSAIGIGLLVALIFLLVLLLIDTLPDNTYFFLSGMDWILKAGFSFFAFVFGYALGFHLQLADLGFAFPTQSAGYSPSPHHPFSSHETSRHTFSSNHHSSVSINPSSGRPMSGSSGVDTSGNPYGTRSW